MTDTKKPLPQMTVEQRESATAHRVPEPDLSPDNLSAECADAIQLNQDAARLIETRKAMYADVDRQLKHLAWPQETMEVLHRHVSKYVSRLHAGEIIAAADEVLGCKGIDQLALLVQDDMCSEVFNLMLQYCLRTGQNHKTDKGFIDGSGIGYLSVFTAKLKTNIEKSFDAKWFYRATRPLSYLWNTLRVDLTAVANKINPGHWSYPQGHSTKSFTAVETLEEVFELTVHCRRTLFIAACIFGHGRDANLIHYPMDTYAAGYNTSLEEFK